MENQIYWIKIKYIPNNYLFVQIIKFIQYVLYDDRAVVKFGYMLESLKTMRLWRMHRKESCATRNLFLVTMRQCR